jgi:hypothetical protein
MPPLDANSASSPTPLVFARPKPHRDLQAGDILVDRHGLTYLTGKTGTVCGYDQWATVRYTGPGQPVRGSTELRADGAATVLEFIGED